MIQFSQQRKWWMAVLLLGLIGAGFTGARYIESRKRCSAPVTIDAWRLPSGKIFIAEDPANKGLRRYRLHEHLDQVVQPYRTDFQRILALAQWTSRQFVATTPFPHYPPWNARIILKRIREGKTGGYCAQYAFVFGQACQSFGYQVRYLDIASPENFGGHFTTEIYVPSMHRWIVFEPEWGFYYVDEHGHPLDALELHRWAVRKGKGAVIKMPSKEIASPEWLRLFYYFRYYLRSNYLTVPVYVKQVDDKGSIAFTPYRLAWLDSYTDNAPNEQNGFVSSDPHDFEFSFHPSGTAPIFCNKRNDIYYQLAQRPPCTLCRLVVPRNVLTRLVKLDFVRDPSYHPLKS
jgi:hypothetical protein